MRRGLSIAFAALLLTAPAAQATARFASPNGKSSGACTTTATACTLSHVDDVTTGPDDVVLLATLFDSTYEVSNTASFTKGERIYAPGSIRPTIKGNTAGQTLVYLEGATIQHVALQQAGPSPALFAAQGSTLINVTATNTNSVVHATALALNNAGTLREVMARTTATESWSISINAGNYHLQNVTAYAPGGQGTALKIVGSDTDVTARNVIARSGDASAIEITGGNEAAKSKLHLQYSNANGISATYADVFQDHVQTAAPSFRNAAAGDLHQTPSSVTRDAGTFATISNQDLDFDSRAAGSAPDIGADEWTPPPTAVTGAATLIGSTVATVTGTVNPNAGYTSYYFQWGPTTSYTHPSGVEALFASQSVGAGGNPVPVSLKLTGLSPSTTYHYRLRASNTTGVSLGLDQTFRTTPPGTPDPGGSEPEPGQPGGAILSLTKASLKPARFRVAKGRTAVSAGRRPIPRGTTFRYTLTEPATVKIAIKRKLAGRRKGKKCVKPTSALRRAKRCTRLVTKGTLTRSSKLGANSVRFTGRIGKRKLAPGRYAAVLAATDAAGNRSGARTLAFQVLAG